MLDFPVTLKSSEIEKSDKVDRINKDKLVNFVVKTKNTIPLLTNEKLLSKDTTEQIRVITEKINNLANNFVKSDYPNESAEEEFKRIKASNEEGTWSASSTSVENTVEIPLIPKTKRGLKFQAAATELNLISDEFFELKNHNEQYASALGKLKREIKIP